MSSRILFLFLVILGIVALAACSGEPSVQLKPPLPHFLDNATSNVREAYHYAMANHEELEKYPCYCGCGAMGHTSNLACYISEVNPNGTFTLDTHAAGCGICVDITLDVMRLRGEGMSSPDVRTYIDAHYSAFGPPTFTPLPVD